jgi:SHAQKYF class myb-like DNA-binding protein
MLGPPLLRNPGSSIEASPIFEQAMHSACAAKVRGSPAPSASNSSHDVTGIAASSLGSNEGHKLHACAAKDFPATGAELMAEDSQCSADSMKPSRHETSAAQSSMRSNQIQSSCFPSSQRAERVMADKFKSRPTSQPLNAPAAFASNAASSKRSRSGDIKKARMVWSEELHNQFLHALTDIGLRHAVPKTIMQVRSSHRILRTVHFVLYNIQSRALKSSKCYN